MDAIEMATEYLLKHLAKVEKVQVKTLKAHFPDATKEQLTEVSAEIERAAGYLSYKTRR